MAEHPLQFLAVLDERLPGLVEGGLSPSEAMEVIISQAEGPDNQGFAGDLRELANRFGFGAFLAHRGYINEYDVSEIPDVPNFEQLTGFTTLLEQVQTNATPVLENLENRIAKTLTTELVQTVHYIDNEGRPTIGRMTIRRQPDFATSVTITPLDSNIVVSALSFGYGGIDVSINGVLLNCRRNYEKPISNELQALALATIIFHARNNTPTL